MRTRKFIVLLAMTGFLLGFSGSANAGVFVPESSTLSLGIGGLPSIGILALPGTESFVVLSDGSIIGLATGHNVGAQSTVWSTVNFGPGTSLFTGVPLISNLKATVQNQAGVIQDGAQMTNVWSSLGNIVGTNAVPGSIGGIMRLNGQIVIHAAGTQVAVPVTKIGGQVGSTTMISIAGLPITVTAGPWINAAVRITSVTSNVITIPERGNIQGVAFTLSPTPNENPRTRTVGGGFVQDGATGQIAENTSVTIDGTQNLLSASKAGTVTVISPMRIITSPLVAGRIPGAATIQYTFVPEPGTMLLLVSGAVGLVVIGRRRMRK
jgi:hypothetical protein